MKVYNKIKIRVYRRFMINLEKNYLSPPAPAPSSIDPSNLPDGSQGE
jgi:hypothetical protein